MHTILIVEDNRDYRTDLAEILRLELYHTLEAENGLIGLEMIKNHMPDLIISDISMPVMTGIEMAIVVRRNQKIADIPLIFISGKDNGLTEACLEDLGADTCLIKTTSIADILNVIHDLLNSDEQ